MGDLLKEIPLSEKRASSAKGTCSIPEDITKKQSHYAQTLSDHKEEIEEVIREGKGPWAREKNTVRIPWGISLNKHHEL